MGSREVFDVKKNRWVPFVPNVEELIEYYRPKSTSQPKHTEQVGGGTNVEMKTPDPQKIGQSESRLYPERHL